MRLRFHSRRRLGQSLAGAIAEGLGINRRRQRRELMRAALHLAHSDLGDEVAREQLHETARTHPRGARGALRSLGVDRGEYDVDRAYRLLRAAISNREVEPIEHERAALFTREETLGRMAMSEALDLLRELQPALPEPGSDAFVASSLTTLLGPRAVGSNDALVRSQLALSIATQYVAIVRGRSDLGSPTTPYFLAPRKIVVSLASDV
jgi:hypothetical protein